MILDPLNLQNNTTRNSYLTKEIISKFQCAFNNLKSLTIDSLSNAVSSLYTKHHEHVSSAVLSENQDTHETEKVLIHTKDALFEKSPEEKEASNLMTGGSVENQEAADPFGPVHLLEMFFGIDAQPATAQSKVVSSSQESGSQGAQMP